MLSSLINGRACFAIFDLADFVLLTKSLLFEIRCRLSCVKSLPDSRAGCCSKEVRIYRLKSSVPALRGIEFVWDARRVLLPLSRRASVSEIVDRDDACSNPIKDSIAAIAGVIDGSVLINLL